VQKIKISFWERFAMELRQTPVKKVKACLGELKSAGIELTPKDLEAHFLAGGDLEKSTKGLILAKEANLPLAWMNVCAIDLSTQGTQTDILKCIQNALETKELSFDSYSSFPNQKIEGITKEKETIRAEITLRYTEPPYPWGIEHNLKNLMDRLGLIVSVAIHTSADFIDLQRKGDGIKHKLLCDAKELLDTVSEVDYKITKI
jgi:uncharacterized protein YqfA (UPF0365 family)